MRTIRGLKPRSWTPGAASFLAVALLPAGVRADLHLPRPEMNLGDVHSGAPLTQEFALVNRGPGVVEILAAQASCGCLAPKPAKRRLEAGEEGTVSLQVNTLGQAAGPQRWTVHVLYREGDQEKRASVEVRANVITELTVRPPALTVFADSAVAHDIVVTDLRPRSLDVRAVRATSPHLKARLAGPERDAEGHRVHRVRLEVGAGHPEGQAHEVVSIYTDDPKYPELKVPVTVVKRSRLRLAVTPASVSLTAPRGQAVPSRIVLLRDAQDAKVVLERVTCDHPAVACTWADGPGNRATVKVSVDRAKLPGDGLRAALQVHVRGPVSETVVIPVSCVVE